MTLFVQSPSRAAAFLPSWTANLAAARRVRIACAYVTWSGIRELQAITAMLDSAAVTKETLVSIDFAITEPQALDRLMTARNSSVRIPNFSAVLASGFRPRNAFHPKLLWIEKQDGSHVVLVGSHNITGPGLQTNWEAGAQLDILTGSPEHQALSAWWNATWTSSTALSGPRLAQYAKQRPRRFAGAHPAVAPGATGTATQTKKPGLHRGEILNLDEATLFFFPLGPPSGGKGTQRDVPKGFVEFFGGKKTRGPGANPNRPLRLMIDHAGRTDPRAAYIRPRNTRWHGNSMFRLNFPHTTTGGQQIAALPQINRYYAIFERVGASKFTLELVAPADIPQRIGPLERQAQREGQQVRGGRRTFSWL